MVNTQAEIAGKIETVINNSCCNPDVVAHIMVNGVGFEAGMHRHLQNEFYKLAIAYIFEMGRAYEKGMYDGRNEYAAKSSWRISQLIKSEGSEYANSPEMWALASHFERVFGEYDKEKSEN